MIFLLSAIRTNSLKSGFKDGIPRLCGEKCLRTFTVLGLQGSPPPMRGKAFAKSRRNFVAGITPAYAGKSTATDTPRKTHRDHPRLCGEKPVDCTMISDSAGSPPPMRGKAFHTKNSLLLIRITPAYAGKSLGVVPNDQRCWDHPRLCGEKLRTAFFPA